MQIRRDLVWACACILLAFVGAARAGYFEHDIPGASDPPGIPRFAGSVIIGDRSSPHDTALIPTGPWEKGGWQRSVKAEGRRTRILYLAPRDANSQEVMRHYRRSLESEGYQALFQCSGSDECGAKVERFYTDESHGEQLTDRLLLKYVFSNSSVQEPRIYSARRTNEQGESDVFVFAAYQDNFADSEAGNRVAIFVEAVETTPVRERMALLKADEIAREITENGHAVLHGIQFDAEEPNMRADARPQLDEVARMLGEHPELSLYVVGHTDNKGTLDEIMDRSRRRAAEVVRALIERYGVMRERLTPMGVGCLAPLATNSTEAGRAKNRRIEMVPR